MDMKTYQLQGHIMMSVETDATSKEDALKNFREGDGKITSVEWWEVTKENMEGGWIEIEEVA